MDIQSSMTSSNPPAMLWVPKNINDHTTFNSNCRANTTIAILTSLRSRPSLHIRKRDIPIKTYNVDQMGPNAQFGGVQLGFGMFTYHVVISLSVKTVPTAPAKKTISIEAINLGISPTFNSVITNTPIDLPNFHALILFLPN